MPQREAPLAEIYTHWCMWHMIHIAVRGELNTAEHVNGTFQTNELTVLFPVRCVESILQQSVNTHGHLFYLSDQHKHKTHPTTVKMSISNSYKWILKNNCTTFSNNEIPHCFYWRARGKKKKEPPPPKPNPKRPANNCWKKPRKLPSKAAFWLLLYMSLFPFPCRSHLALPHIPTASLLINFTKRFWNAQQLTNSLNPEFAFPIQEEGKAMLKSMHILYSMQEKVQGI